MYKKNHITFSAIFNNKYFEFDFDKIKEIIVNQEIEIVSFDIFDTLLLRPVLDPKDIFMLLEKVYNVNNFAELRGNANNNAGPYDEIDDIYDQIKKTYYIPDKICEDLKMKELEIEYNLLYARKSIFDFYSFIASLGLRIIAISDMYLTSDFLKRILDKNGYTQIHKIYVSCEKSARKSFGDLYKKVVNEENILPSKILHIGDNFQTDYLNARYNGLISIWYPSCAYQARNSKIGRNKLINFEEIDNIYLRLIYGYAINECFDKVGEINKKSLLINEKIISYFFLFPVLFHAVISVYNDNSIQKQYSEIYFVSRDGYLLKKVYDRINKKNEKVKSIYLYASRRAYQYLIYKNPLERINIEQFNENYTFENFIDSMIYDKDILLKIKSNYKKNELEFVLSKDMKIVKKLIEENEEINLFYENAKGFSEIYYNSLLGNKQNRKIAFDCGYSGSISLALSSIAQIDKIYLWENNINKVRDKKNRTKTVVLIGEERPVWNDIVYEKLLSSTEGSCEGFTYINGNIVPILSNDMQDLESKSKIIQIQKITEEGCVEFCKLLGDLKEHFVIKDGTIVMANIYRCVKHLSYKKLGIFNRISFNDNYFNQKNYNLGKYISQYNYSINHYMRRIKELFHLNKI